ncbi:diaminopimelate decarboxylase [Enterobacteriaceae bacterium RIT691]|nr:diaminopimelate decarboxylase [Enterobacteriaceae bacterium RIT691]
MWEIITTETYDRWHAELTMREESRVLATLRFLQEEGPMLSRPYADTVKGSRFRHMKELRIQSHGDPLRVFFAFSPTRKGILLCAGNKVGDEKRFYDIMIPIADQEYTEYLNHLYQSR